MDSWGRLNIMVPSYQYKNSHYKDETVTRPFYLWNANPHTCKDRIYIVVGSGSQGYVIIKTPSAPTWEYLGHVSVEGQW